jgi:uncharacterized repeat protein (TIGR03806 family)
MNKLAVIAWSLLLVAGCDSGAPVVRGTPPSTDPPPANPNSGLDARPANATCVAWPRPSVGSDISLSRFTALSFTSPLALLQAPNDSARWYVVEQGGAVKLFSGANPASSSTFVDITSRVRSGGEMGLLGMAFHPNFPTDNRVFLSYTTGTSPLVSRVSSFRSNDAGMTLDAGSESILLTINQPETNHNGGHIAFGPDGLLYIGIGDGGGGGDIHGDRGNGQRLTILLGKLLRIDINGAPPYTIPPTNPFAANAVCPAAGRASGECPEIYAYGFRNPWRWNFDRDNGELWLADVGQSLWEEVNQVALGGNYGWRCREGAHDFNPSTPGCSSGVLIDPVTEYNHTLGNSITGGYVYRGSQPTGLRGRYLFADFGSGRIWAWIPESATQPREPTQLLDTELNISSFGQGNDGELYVIHYGGTLHKVTFEGNTGGNAAPQLLSQTGCFSSTDTKQPASGLIPYTINAPFWSDGANKDRWMALPDGQNITVQATDGDWNFPNGTVLVKNFSTGSRLIETRLFMRHPDGVWGGFSYEWNSAQTDATLLEGGAVRDLGGGQSWIFPSESQCLDCHTDAAGRALGLETAQLNRSLTYSQTGRTANELTTLNHIGMLTPAITDASAQPVMPEPFGTSALGDRARAYLHTNCSQCHRPSGPTPSAMDFRYSTSLMGTGACDVVPQSGDLGLGVNARLIAPGSPENSLVVNRMNRRDTAAMPPLGSHTVDAEGVALVTQWIDGLATCQ